jgi:hypothetical protein
MQRHPMRSKFAGLLLAIGAGVMTLAPSLILRLAGLLVTVIFSAALWIGIVRRDRRWRHK